VQPHPIGTPPKGLSPNTGPLAAAAWLMARGLTPPDSRWHAEINISTTEAAVEEQGPTVFRVELYSEEWGFWFRHAGKVSWIRVTDLPFVHGHDEHGLLADTPALKNLGTFVRTLERRFGFQFALDAPHVRSSLMNAETAIREWLAAW
jgi:hypothetical protein